MRVTRKASKTKGARWKKGNSSVFIPQTRKHRDEAKKRFFKNVVSNSQLTTSALKFHEASEKNSSIFNKNTEEMQVCDDEHSDTQSVGGESNVSWASMWSDCSNISFNKLLDNWDPTSALHKEMLAVLAATTEIIKSEGGKETETEYFAIFLTTLGTAETDMVITATTCLINIVLPRVPPSLVRVKFDVITKEVLALLEKYINTEYGALLKAALNIASYALRQQPASAWNTAKTKDVYKAVLMFVIHSKPSVRKLAQRTVCGLLRHLESSKEAWTIAADFTMQFCIDKMNESGVDITTSHVMNFLRFALPLFTQKGIKNCCEAVFKAMTLGCPTLSICGLQTLSFLFIYESPIPRVNANLNAQVINALYDFKPSLQDSEQLCAWVFLMQAALRHLHKVDEELFAKNVGKVLQNVITCFLCDTRHIHTVLEQTLTLVFETCVTPSAKLLVDTAVGNETAVDKIIEAMEVGLKYSYHAVWGSILKLWARLFDAFGKLCPDRLVEYLTRLAGLRETDHFSFSSDLNFALGAAIRNLGPKAILKQIPLKLNGGHADDMEFSRSWLLPLLRDYIRNTQLAYFFDYFVPLADAFTKAAERFLSTKQTTYAFTYQTLAQQCWSIFPAFCHDATDIAERVPKHAKFIGMVLSEDATRRKDVLAGLRYLVRADLDQNLGVMTKYSKNYLPIMFNLYAVESLDKSLRLALFDTIKTYYEVTSQELCFEFFDRAVKNFEEIDKKDIFQRAAVIDIIGASASKLDTTRLVRTMQMCRTLIETERRKIQKKAYRLMEEVLHTEIGKNIVSPQLDVIEAFFAETRATTSVTSVSVRLRCMKIILELQTSANPTFVAAIVSEALLNTRGSIKAKEAALSAIILAGDKLQEWNGDCGLDELVGLLLAGFCGTANAIACGVAAVTYVFHHYRDRLKQEHVERLCDVVFTLIESKTSHVARTALKFISTVVTKMDIVLLGSRLPDLVQKVCSVQETHRQLVWVILTKLYRKFGYDFVLRYVPEKYNKVFKNINKVEKRKERARASVAEGDDEDIGDGMSRVTKTVDEMLESSEEDDDLPQDDRKTIGSQRSKKSSRSVTSKAWIREKADEDIVDFLDPKAGQNITGTDPNRPKKSGSSDKSAGFKITEDGRFVITEDDADDDRTNRKRKRNDDSSSDDSDDDGITEALDGVSIKTGGSRITIKTGSTYRKPLSKKARTIKSLTETGDRFKAKKAGGDMKKAGKPDPYAYFPMDKHFLNKRRRIKLQGQFKGIVKGTKKQSNQGRRSRKRND